MKLNFREKALIIILAAIIILLGGFKLVIEPELKTLDTKKADYQTALNDKQTADINVLRAKSIDAENAALEAKISTEVQPFFPELKSDKVQVFFNGLTDAAGISFKSFNMTDPVATQINNPGSAGKGITYPANEAANGIESIESDKPIPAPTATPAPNNTDAQANQAPDLIEMTTVTMQFEGTTEQALKLLDGIKNSGKLIRVSACDIDVSLDSNNKTTTTVTITAECFGVKKFTTGDPLSQDSLPLPTGGNAF